MKASPGLDEFLKNNEEWRQCPDLLVSPPTADELREWYPDTTHGMLTAARDPVRIGKFMVTRGALYAQMRNRGESGKLADMVAMQQGPGLNTDSVFFSGCQPLYDQFESQKHLDRHLANAKKHGFTPSKNAVYMPGLARFQGDPEAFVDHTQGRGYIKKLCERRGWACDGAVTVAKREPESDPLADKNCVPLAKDIIQRRAKEMVKADPSLARLNRQDLRQKIIDKHGPSK